jgi:hypothetical protein
MDKDSPLGQKAGIELTLLFWQPRAPKNLTAEDARQMIENVTGFFAQLEAWDAHDLEDTRDRLVPIVSPTPPRASRCQEGQEENVAA